MSMTQKSKYLMVFLLFVTSVFSFNGRDGCSCDKGVLVPPKPPTCVGATFKDYYYEYDYMSGWPIFYDTNHPLRLSLFARYLMGLPMPLHSKPNRVFV